MSGGVPAQAAHRAPTRARNAAGKALYVYDLPAFYRIPVTGAASLIAQFPSVGEIGTLQSLGSDLLRLGSTSDSCFIGCRQVPTSATGFSVNGAPATTLFFDIGTYANGPLLVADSVFGGGGGGVTQAVPVADPIGLFALMLALILSALVVGRLAHRSVV